MPKITLFRFSCIWQVRFPLCEKNFPLPRGLFLFFSLSKGLFPSYSFRCKNWLTRQVGRGEGSVKVVNNSVEKSCRTVYPAVEEGNLRHSGRLRYGEVDHA